LPSLADRAALFAGDEAVAVRVGPVERLQTQRRHFRKGDASVIVGVDAVEALRTQPSHDPAAIVAALHALSPALEADLTALATIRALARCEELRAADFAVAVRIKLCKACFTALAAIGRALAASGVANRSGFRLSDEAVAIGVGSGKCCWTRARTSARVRPAPRSKPPRFCWAKVGVAIRAAAAAPKRMIFFMYNS
jgi:hypothetical protein